MKIEIYKVIFTGARIGGRRHQNEFQPSDDELLNIARTI